MSPAGARYGWYRAWRGARQGTATRWTRRWPGSRPGHRGSTWWIWTPRSVAARTPRCAARWWGEWTWRVGFAAAPRAGTHGAPAAPPDGRAGGPRRGGPGNAAGWVERGRVP